MGWLYLFEQLRRHLLQTLPPDTHRVEGNQDDTKEAGHGEEQKELTEAESCHLDDSAEDRSCDGPDPPDSVCRTHTQ